MDERQRLERLVRCASSDHRVLAVILFGSVARGQETEDSDIDVCLVAASGIETRGRQAELRLDYAGRFDLDVALFQQLPLYLRRRVLAEGRVLFVRDEDPLYDLALRTVQQFEDYRPLYEAYLEGVARGGS